MANPRAPLFIQILFFSVPFVCCISGVSGDVPHDVVYTDLHKTVHRGDSVVLPCRFRGTPLAVYWKKGDDPETSPNLVSWIPTDDVTGLCEGVRPCQIMEMNENRSLVIKEVSIAEQGRYICRVTIKGILIHNFTDISVFSPPMEPFPLIEECRGILPNDAEQTCSLSTSDNITITCSASSYFPDIDLFFFHGSKKTDATNIEEVANTDGTKTKSTSIVAEPSESPYVCVASDIPGSQDQRTVTVTVTFPGSTVVMSTSSNQTTLAPSQSGDVAKVVIPIIVVILILAAICVAMGLQRRRKHRKKQERDDQESMPLCPYPQIKGKVSFFELWYLVRNMDETNLNILRGALIDLGITGVEDELTADKAFDLLCDWKDTNTLGKEGMKLESELVRHELGCSWEEMCERRANTNAAFSEELLDHVLWSIGDETKICRFLRELITDKRETRRNVSGNKGEVIKESMVVLREWRDKEHKESQDIQLSLALERAKCKPLDRTFFKVPEHLMKAISPQEVEGFVYRLTGRHCKRLANAVGITDEKKIETIMNENNEDLVLIQSMVMDWVDGQECCNFEKRCMLDDATIKSGRHDMTDSFGTTRFRVDTGSILERPHPNAKTFNSTSLFDDDLASLLRHLPTCAIPLFLEKLGISVDEESDDLEQKLRCWRDQNIKESKRYSLQTLVSIHSDALNETNESHVLGLNDDELENVIGSMTSVKQVEELTSRLGLINEKEQPPFLQLKEWRNSCKMDERRITLRKALYALELQGCIVDRLPAKHVYQAELVRLAWTMFYIDVWPLATLLKMDMVKEKTVGEPHMKGTIHLLKQLLQESTDLDMHRRRFLYVAIRNLGYFDVARSGFLGYDASISELCNLTTDLSEDEIVKLVKHLGLEKDVLSVFQGTTGPYDNVKLMKIWRNQLRLQPLHFRFELASGLRAAGRTDIANRILAVGGHHKTEVNSRVVESICNSLAGDQLERLREHLGLKAQDDQNTTTATLVTEWVRNWLKEFDTFSPMQYITDKLNSRGNRIDNLFRAGFVKLAEEVMLLDISRILLAKPADKGRKDKSCGDESDNEADNEEYQEVSVEQASETMPVHERWFENTSDNEPEIKPNNEECKEALSKHESGSHVDQ